MKKSDSSISESLSFTVLGDERQEIKYVFSVNNRKLIKLGDGTYSVVFECRSVEGGKPAAVKLFYLPAQGMRLAEQRFKDEIEASSLIRKGLKPTLRSESQDKSYNVVQIYGGTTCFKQSSAYKKAQNLFDRLCISDYAVVSEKYERTLKQVLENKHVYYTVTYKDFEPPIEGMPLCRTSGELERFLDRKELYKFYKERPYKKEYFTGYDILRGMDFETRIRTILPFIKDIGKGIRTLHEAGFLHLDIKPANIFVKDGFDEFTSSIGDLGFLKPRDYELFEVPPLVPGASSDLPLGTLHYRSPEQKDYFDITDAKLTVDENKVTLSIEDPKFLDTIITKGDFAYFSKATAAAKIENIFINNDSRTTEISLLVSKESRNKIASDPRTQVVFYKRQQLKTDLFGFGAIVFDLITCGRSPERFYEIIKSFDRSLSYRSQASNIQEIVDRYDQASSFRLGDANFSELFSPFRLNEGSSVFAPKSIVELILKCMLYRCQGIYFDSIEYNKPGAPQNIMVEVLKKIDELEKEYHPTIKNYEENLLYASRMPNSEETFSASTGTFEDKLKEVCSIPKERYIFRLVQGIKMFRELMGLAFSISSETGGNFFAELNPQNIQIVDHSIEFNSITYKRKQDYLDDVRADLFHTRLSADLTNPYIPQHFSFIRRRLQLTGNSRGEDKVLPWTYEFEDFSIYGDRINSGDWIIFAGQTRNVLYQISAINKANKTLRLNKIKEQNSKDLNNNRGDDLPKGGQSTRVIFYENLEPRSYSFQMLSSYIHRLFFVGIDDNKVNSLFSNIMLSLTSQQMVSDILINQLDGETNLWRKISSTRKQKENFYSCLSSIIEVYLKLAFPSSPQSYLGNTEGSSKAQLEIDIRSIEDKLASLVDPRYKSWPSIVDFKKEELNSKIKDLRAVLGAQVDEKIDFYRLVSERIDLTATSDGAFLRSLFR